MEVAVHAGIEEIDAREWNTLVLGGYPFLRHEFLAAAESSGSVSPETGWIPRHLSIRANGKLRAAQPLYEKHHSWGEFVFDWAWAQAYQRAGLPYYPKLVSAVPFTPATSRRALLADPADTTAAVALTEATLELARQSDCSSAHVLFPEAAELDRLVDCGLRLRKDCQFHWRNHDYADFDQFLGEFSSAKRKKARRDRRRVSEAGIGFRHLKGADIDPALWSRIYELISVTFMQRGSQPYFNFEFFTRIAAELPENILVILAEKSAEPIAAAVCFVSDDTLYGRYWGSDGHYDALHFETCYYQGIEYCIKQGLQRFEPGTQGEHKISRGFTPTTTWSAHWLAQPEFFSAIERYLDEEARHIDRYMEAVDSHSPFRADRQAEP